MIDAYFLMVMFVTLAWIWGWTYTFKSGEIFGRVGDWGREKLPEWISKPLFDCPYCCSSVHGTIFFVLFLWGYPWYLWIVFVVCITGVGAMVRPN